MKYLIILILTIQSVFAEDSVKYVNIGDPAPFSGYLFSVEKEKRLRLMDQEFDLCNRKSELLSQYATKQEQIMLLSDKKIALYETQIDRLSKQVVEQRDATFWQNAFYFIGGAVLTGVIAYGYSRTVIVR